MIVLGLLLTSLFFLNPTLTGQVTTGPSSLASFDIDEVFSANTTAQVLSLPIDNPLSSLLVSGEVRGSGEVQIILFNDTDEWTVYFYNASAQKNSLTGFVTKGLKATINETPIETNSASNSTVNKTLNKNNFSNNLSNSTTFLTSKTNTSIFPPKNASTNNTFLENSLLGMVNNVSANETNSSFALVNTSLTFSNNTKKNVSLATNNSVISSNATTNEIVNTTNSTAVNTTTSNTTVRNTTTGTIATNNTTASNITPSNNEASNIPSNETINASNSFSVKKPEEILAVYSFTNACADSCELPNVNATHLRIVVSGNAQLYIKKIAFNAKPPFSQKQTIPDQTVPLGFQMEIDLSDFFVITDDVIFDTPSVAGLTTSIRDNRYLVISPQWVGKFPLFVYATNGDDLQRSNVFTVIAVNDNSSFVKQEQQNTVDMNTAFAKSLLNNSKVVDYKEALKLVQKVDHRSIKEVDKNGLVRVMVKTQNVPRLIKVVDNKKAFTPLIPGESASHVVMKTMTPKEAKLKFKDENLDGKMLLDVGEDVPLEVKQVNNEYVTLQVTRKQLEELLLSNEVDEVSYDQPMVVETTESIALTHLDDLQMQGYDGTGIKVCILDTGLNPSAVGLSDGVNVFGYNFVDDNNDYSDNYNHGTKVTYPLTKILPNATFYMGKVLDDSGNGYASTVLSGIDWCVSQGVDVISMSFGGGYYENYCDETPLGKKIAFLATLDGGRIPVVVATGNTGYTNGVQYPACSYYATRVAASDKQDNFWPQSDFNNATLLVSPGVNIQTIDNTGHAVLATGTSMAVPFVTGAVAIMKKNNSKMLDVKNIWYRLVHTGALITYNSQTFARLNVSNILIPLFTNDLMEGHLGEESFSGTLQPLAFSNCGQVTGQTECNSYACCYWSGSCLSNADQCNGSCGSISWSCTYCDGTKPDCQSVPSGGHVCNMYDNTSVKDVDASDYCGTSNHCTAGSCSGVIQYQGCDGSGSCDTSYPNSNDYAPTMYASSYKVLTSTCSNQDATSSVKCDSTVNSCTVGACSGTTKFPECYGSGSCDSSAGTYYQGSTIYASAGNSYTSTSCAQGATACNTAWQCTNALSTNGAYNNGGNGKYTQGFCDGGGSCDYSGSVTDDGDYNSAACECEASGTQGTCSDNEAACWFNNSYCCGDDANEYSERDDEWSTGTYITWADGALDACCAARNCVDSSGNCYAYGSVDPDDFGKKIYGNLNSGGNDTYAYCYWGSSDAGWLDCDANSWYTTWCKNATICGSTSGVYAGESGVGEYPDTSTLGCCGDDANEYYRYRNEYSSWTDEFSWNDNTSDAVCCDTSTDCVYGGTCYSAPADYDLNGDGKKEARCYQSGSQWINVDYNIGFGCAANGGTWMSGVNKGDATGDNFPATHGDTGNANYCAYYRNLYGAGFHASTSCCCGDDPGEYYRSGSADLSGNGACCDLSTDCVDASGICRANGYITCDGDAQRTCNSGTWSGTTACPDQTCSGASNADSYLTDSTCTAGVGCSSQSSVECPTCQTCSGTSCVAKTDNTQDTIGSNTCDSTCAACQSGSCGNANDNTDPGNDCSAGYTSCDDICTKRGPDGNCDDAGACDTNDAVANVADNYYCSSGNEVAGSCATNTHVDYQCSSTACDGDAQTNYADDYCSAGSCSVQGSWKGWSTTTACDAYAKCQDNGASPATCYNPASTYNSDLSTSLDPAVTDNSTLECHSFSITNACGYNNIRRLLMLVNYVGSANPDRGYFGWYDTYGYAGDPRIQGAATSYGNQYVNLDASSSTVASGSASGGAGTVTVTACYSLETDYGIYKSNNVSYYWGDCYGTATGCNDYNNGWNAGTTEAQDFDTVECNDDEDCNTGSGYYCSSGSCVNSCSQNSNCLSGYYCSSGGTCAAEKGEGGTCDFGVTNTDSSSESSGVCSSGYCRDDYDSGNRDGDCDSGDQCWCVTSSTSCAHNAVAYANGYEACATADAKSVCSSGDWGSNVACPDQTCSGATNADYYLTDSTCSQGSGCSAQVDTQCAACLTCSGGSCVSYSDNVQDVLGSNTCDSTCAACQSGSCGNANDNTDPGDDCSAGYTSCDDICTKRGPDGNCDDAGACDTNDAVANVADNYYCSSGNEVAGQCSGVNHCANQYQFYTGYTCSSGSCSADDGLTNVGAGNVCSSGVAAQPSGNTNCGTGSQNCYCANTWYQCDAVNDCTYDQSYVGFANGASSCDGTDAVERSANVVNPVGYRCNTATGSTAYSSYSGIMDTNQCSGVNSCANQYQFYTGYTCSGGSCGGANGLSNVTVGDVCDDGASVDPSYASTCGNGDAEDCYCAVWHDCVLNNCSAAEYLVGFDGSGSCVDTDWQSNGTMWNVPDNYIISTTNHADACTTTNSGRSASYTSCDNQWTRRGADGYCDGSGSLDTDDASTPVAVGDVCKAGANVNPDGTSTCGSSDSELCYCSNNYYQCDAVNDCTYDRYYAGFDASSNCTSAGAQLRDSDVVNPAGYRCNTADTTAYASYSSIMDTNQCSGVNHCANQYQFYTGYTCSSGSCSADDGLTTVSTGDVCGPSAVGENPSGDSDCGVGSSNSCYCDRTIDCTTGSCSAFRYYRGYTSSGTCTDTGRVAYTSWDTSVANTISETAYKSATTCSESATACNAAWQCTSAVSTDNAYASGFGYYAQGYCDGSGSCDRSGSDVSGDGDSSSAACECLESGTQGNCVVGDTNCWLSSASSNQCCQGTDTQCDGANFDACVSGVYRTDRDSYQTVCECGSGTWDGSGWSGDVTTNCCDGSSSENVLTCVDDASSFPDAGTCTGSDIACCDVSSDCVTVDGSTCVVSGSYFGNGGVDGDVDGDTDYCNAGTWSDCNVDGDCDTGSGFHCVSNDCVNSCTTNANCPSGYFCSSTGGGTCLAQLADGATCVGVTQTSNYTEEDSACSSTYCDNDGVGAPDGNHCYTPNGNYDPQDSNTCEKDANNALNDNADERRNECNAALGYVSDTCVYTTEGDNDNETCYCRTGATGNWDIGGETASTTCCGDDAGENNKDCICGASSGCTTDSSDDACCSAATDCVYTSTCYDSNSSNITAPWDGDLVVTCNAGTWNLVDNCTSKSSTDTDGGNVPGTQGTVTDYTTSGGSQCAFNQYTDACGGSGVNLTEYIAVSASYGHSYYYCNDFEVVATGDTANDPTTTGTCTAGTAAGCSAGAFTTSAGTGSGTDSCSGTCGTGIDSCSFTEYYAVDSGDICSGLDSCTSTTYDADTNSNTCNTCGETWATGGESSGFGEYTTGSETECCGDDSSEFYRNGAAVLSGGSARCCSVSTDCVDASSACQADGYDDGTNVCSSGTWKLSNGQVCSADGDCASNDCNPAPNGTHYCTDASYECARNDGVGLDTNDFTCNTNDGNIYQCTGEDSISQSTDCSAQNSSDTDGGNVPETAGTTTDYVSCTAVAQTTCPSNTYSDVCTSTTALTEYYDVVASYSSQAYVCGNFEVVATGDTANDPTTTGTCTAGTGASCSSNAFTTAGGSGGTDACEGTCGTGTNSCLFREYYAIDSADACSGLDTCTSTTYDADTNSNTCSACLGSGYWAIGGDTASSSCCGDDNAEYQITETAASDSPTPYDANTGTSCCAVATDCTEAGTDTCTATTTTAGSIPNRAYCNAGTWQGGDDSSTACTAIMGSSGYWAIGGEVAATSCCGDDGSGVENQVNTTLQTGLDAALTDVLACCNVATDCADDNTCTPSGSTRDVDADGDSDYCAGTNGWYDCNTNAQCGTGDFCNATTHDCELADILVSYQSNTPANNERTIDNSVTVNVSVISPGANVDTCLLEWGGSNVSMTMVGSGTNVYCYETTSTIDGTDYTFKVWANNSVGSWGNESLRSIRENALPPLPTHYSPADASRVIGNSQTLEWSAGGTDVDGDTITYYWRVDTDATPASPFTCNGSTTTNQSTSCTTTDGTTYYWNIITSDGYQNRSATTPWSFTENTMGVVTKPELSPAGATVLDGVNCSTNYSDAQTDSGTIYFDWLVNNVSVYTSSQSSIASGTNQVSDILGYGNTSEGDEVRCVVRAWDGYENGTKVNDSMIINSACGVTITSNTTLLESITGCSGNGLIIGGNGVILDCGGFEITGSTTNSGVLISGYAGIQVRNCNISAFTNGISSTSGSDTVILENNTLHENTYGIALSGNTQNVLIDNSTILSNTLNGIYLTSASTNIKILRSTIEDNTDSSGNDAGIYFATGGAALVANNTFTHTTGYASYYSARTALATDNALESNWWGTTNISIVENRVYDYYDSGSLGVLDVCPILNATWPAGSQIGGEYYRYKQCTAGLCTTTDNEAACCSATTSCVNGVTCYASGSSTISVGGSGSVDYCNAGTWVDCNTNAECGAQEFCKADNTCQAGELNVTYQSNTPADNERTFANTITINVSVDSYGGDVDTCLLEWNSTTNVSMTMVGSGTNIYCYKTSATTDGTDYSFRVWANNTIAVSDVENLRSIRENDEPSISSVSLTPVSPTTHQDLNCSVSGWSDADGDSEQYYYTWYKNDVFYTSTLSTLSYNVTSNTATTKNDRWNCSVTPWDGYENGSSLKDNVTILAIKPNVNLLEPSSSWITGDTPIFECNASSDVALSNISLFTDVTGAWTNSSTNASLSLTTTTQRFSLNNLTSGSYVWSCRACDSEGVCSFSTSNRTFTVDTKAPGLWFTSATPKDGQRIPSTDNVTVSIDSGDAYVAQSVSTNSSVIGYWTFDNVSGTTIYDASSEKNNATRTGNGVAVANGYVNDWAFFDGDAGYISTPDTVSFNFSQQNFTLVTWARVDTWTDRTPLIAKKNSELAGDAGWALYIDNDNNVYGQISNGTVQYTVQYALGDTDWHFYALVYNDTHLRLFVDGTEQDSVPVNTSFNVSSTNDVLMGEFTTPHAYLQGALDTVRVFTDHLSASSISSLYTTERKGYEKSINHSIVLDWNATLALWLTFDSITGSSISDQSSQSNDGIIAGAPYESEGMYGHGLTFDGIDDYVNITDADSLTCANALTLETWVRFTQKPSAGNYYPIIKKRRGSSDSYQLFIDSNGHSLFTIDTGTDVYSQGTTDLSDGFWHHIAGTWNGSLLRLFVDGKEEDSDAKTGTLSDTADNVVIGYGTSLASAFVPFNGSLDEVRIACRALSAKEVNASMNAQQEQYFRTFTNFSSGAWATFKAYGIDGGGNIASLAQRNITSNTKPLVDNVTLSSSSGNNITTDNLTVSYDTFDGDANTLINTSDWRNAGISLAVVNMPFNVNVSDVSSGAIKDYSTSSNDGSLGGTVSYDAPTWTSNGEVGGAYEFDGVNDYISIPHSGGSDITVMFWVNKTFSNTRRCTVKGGSGANQFIMRLTSTGEYSVYLGSGTPSPGYHDTSGAGINEQEWHHIAWTYNKTKLKLYVDGALNREVDVSRASDFGSDVIRLGYPYSGAEYFKGVLDEFFVANTILSADQINESYQAGLVGKSIEKIRASELSAGDTWSVALTPTDSVEDGDTVVSNTLGIEDASPVVVLNNSFVNWTTAHMFNVTAGVKYSLGASNIKNTSIIYTQGTCDYLTNVSSGNYFNVTYNCSGTPFVSNTVNITFCSTSGKCVTTPQTNNAYPNQIPTLGSLLSPSDGNSSLINRNVTFNWSSATDAEGDALNYTINVTNRNGTDTSSLCLGFTDTISDPTTIYNYNQLLHTYSECNPLSNEGYRYFWQIKVCDVYNCSSYSSWWNFSITDYLDFSLTTDLINFSEIGTLEPADIEDTLDDIPAPFVAENKGNVEVNITNVTATTLWSSAPLDTSYFRYRAGNTSEANSFNWSTSQTTWENFTGTSNTDVLIANLGYLDVADTAEVDIYVKVPPSEPIGARSSTVNFQIELAN